MKLLDYQVEAVYQALKTPRVLINLPAGSGKSLIALQVAERSNARRVLIVCPSFLKLNWEYEIKKWYKTRFPHTILIDNEGHARAVSRMSSVIAVVGYPFFQKTKNLDSIKDQKFDLVICDESQRLRKWESKQTKNVILKVAKKCKRLLFLSATPLVTSAADLHPTFSVMEPGKWGTNAAFKEKYCEKVPDLYKECGFRYVGINSKNAKELKARSRNFVFSRKKSVVLSQLPPKVIIDVPVKIGASKLSDMDIEALLGELVLFGEEPDDIKTERERVGREKIKHVLELLETIPKSEPVVIFAYHRSVVIEIAKMTNKETRVSTILGGMSEELRMSAVESFTSGKTNRLVASMGAAGLGLNLQTASIAIFAELPLSHAEFEQCSDRVHRLGSTKQVRIFKVVAVNSMDERINEMIETKRLSAENAGVAT